MSGPLDDFVEALDRLEEVLDLPVNDVVRDAAIKRFEICFELGWKSVQRSLRHEGLDCRSPRRCFELAYQQGWIDDASWVAMIRDRNLTAHTYDRALAERVHEKLPAHYEAMRGLAEALSRTT